MQVKIEQNNALEPAGFLTTWMGCSDRHWSTGLCHSTAVSLWTDYDSGGKSVGIMYICMLVCVWESSWRGDECVCPYVSADETLGRGVGGAEVCLRRGSWFLAVAICTVTHTHVAVCCHEGEAMSCLQVKSGSITPLFFPLENTLTCLSLQWLKQSCCSSVALNPVCPFGKNTKTCETWKVQHNSSFLFY